jgi:5,10-methylenetetrahydromethanopterin reductase
MKMRIGIFACGPGMGLDAPLDEMLERFVKAEADGLASAWAANIFNYDALTLVTLAGRATKTLELGTAVTPTYPRHPAALAQQALTAQAAVGNRLTVGIGLSHKLVIESLFGLDYSTPIRHMREYLSVLTGLLTGQPTAYQGKEYRVGAQITVPGAARPAVLIAALGPKMLKLAGTMADGTITWMGGPKYLEQTAVPLITKAAREAGRPAPRVVAGFPIAVTSKPDVARAAAVTTFAMYSSLPAYRAILDIEGAPDAAGASIIGDEAEVRRRLKHLSDIGVTDLNAAPFPIADDPSAMQRTLEFLAEAARTGV